MLLGSERALGLLPGRLPAQSARRCRGDLDELAAQVAAVGDRRAVVLVFGDPMFYGVARYLCERLGKDRFEVVPHVSSMQLAFARVKESWDEAYLTNLANHPIDAVVEQIRTAEKVGLFTTENSARRGRPGAARPADRLLHRLRLREPRRARRAGHARRAGRDRRAEVRPAERDDPGPPADVPDRPRDADRAAAVRQPRRGVPAVAAQAGAADPGRGAVDGPGPDGHRPGQRRVGRRRRERLGERRGGAARLRRHRLRHRDGRRRPRADPRERRAVWRDATWSPVLGKAPEAWADLPDPDCVFVAGGGREVTPHLRGGLRPAPPRRPPGGQHAAIDNLAELYEQLDVTTHNCRVLMVNISEVADQLGRLTFDSLKPSFLLSAVKATGA